MKILRKYSSACQRASRRPPRCKVLHMLETLRCDFKNSTILGVGLRTSNIVFEAANEGQTRTDSGAEVRDEQRDAGRRFLRTATELTSTNVTRMRTQQPSTAPANDNGCREGGPAMQSPNDLG